MSDPALQAVIQRLEAATLRLEEIVKSKGGSPSTGPAAPPADDGPLSASVSSFDDLIGGPLKTFLAQSRTIGGLVKDQGEAVEAAFVAQRKLILTASQSKKPDVTTFQELLKPIQAAIEKISDLREKNRPSPFFNHLSTVSEGIPALGWVAVEPTPAPYVGEMRDSAVFYANRVIKEYKDKDKTHVEWANSYTSLLSEVQVYVKKWHTTGLSWNPRGGDAKSVASSASKPPAPPAVPTPEQLEKHTGGASDAKIPSGHNSLFSEIGKGNVTTGLRKVDKSEMTHKNPELRASSIVKASDGPSAPVSKGPVAAPKAPPKLELEGNKWVVENHTNNSSIVIDKTELKNVVYIYNCTNSTIQIKGKVNAITLDNCKKTGLLVENVVSTVDIVNCKSVQLQITGKAPTVAVDKTDGLQLYLSKECAGIEILSAKSSEMNVLFQEGASDEYTEKPIVEQYLTKIVNGSLVTIPVEHTG